MGELTSKLAPFVNRRPEILFFCPDAGTAPSLRRHCTVTAPSLFHHLAAAGLASASGHAGLWCNRQLSDYDELEPLHDEGRHKVMKGSFKGAPCVLKRFAVGDARNRRQVEKEIRVLSKLKHALIIELQVSHHHLHHHRTFTVPPPRHHCTVTAPGGVFRRG